MKKYLFGWTNIKWLIKQLIALGSNNPSYFSKKRIESGIAFVVAQFGMIYFLVKNVGTMDVYDICIWATTEFAVAGYMISQIQREKKEIKTENNEDQ
jgi:hypothetical protein